MNLQAPTHPQVSAALNTMLSRPTASCSDVPEVDQLCQRITSGKWRRSTVDAETSTDIRQKVQRQFVDGQPIEFSLPFGGYKSWRQSSFPHLNWADVMWAAHIRRYAAHIAQGYPGGVVVSFTYYSAALDIVNNLRLSDQTVYIDELDALLADLSTSDVHLRLVDLVSQHKDVETFRAELLARRDELIDSRYQPTSEQSASALRNLVLSGERDLRQLSPDELLEEAESSAVSCLAMESLPQRRDFNKFSHRIQLGHIRGPALTVHLGSTRVSTLQPWVGVGYLARHSKQPYIETIASSLPATEAIEVVGIPAAWGPALTTIPVEPAEQQIPVDIDAT